MDVIPQSYFFQSKSEVTKFKLKFLPSLVRFINKIQRNLYYLSVEELLHGVGKLGLIHHRHRANIHSIRIPCLFISNLSISPTCRFIKPNWNLKFKIIDRKSKVYLNRNTFRQKDKGKFSLRREDNCVFNNSFQSRFNRWSIRVGARRKEERKRHGGQIEWNVAGGEPIEGESMFLIDELR